MWCQHHFSFAARIFKHFSIEFHVPGNIMISMTLGLALWEIESVGIPYGRNIFFRLYVL